MFELVALPFLMLPAEFPLAAFFWLLAFPIYGIGVWGGTEWFLLRVGAPVAFFLLVAAANASTYRANPNGWLKFTGSDLFWMSAVPCGVALLFLLTVIDLVRVRRARDSSGTEF